MKLTANELDTFAASCARHLNPGRLESFARQHKLIDDIEEFIKLHSVGQSNSAYSVARAILDKANQRELACDIAEIFFSEMLWSDEFKSAVGPLTRSAKSDVQAHQALMARRDHFLSDSNLKSLANTIGARVCCIVGELLIGVETRVTTGTGFLVGPDLVLTSMHVLDTLVQAGRAGEVPDCFKVIFNYEAGSGITGLANIDQLAGIRVVGLSPDWLVYSRDKVDWDGNRAHPTPADITELKSKLDFALIRLAEPVGLQPIRPGNLKPRGWLPIARLTSANFQNQTRIIIPQHPEGWPRQFDFGRLDKLLPCGTRMVSIIETAAGTSGAPCLDKEMRIVGIHNAAYRPNGPVEGNQAIRFDVVEPLIAAHLANVSVDPPKAMGAWRVERTDSTLSPILGRTRLLNWINATLSPADGAMSRADRVYAADASKAGSGKTFSTHILRSALSADRSHIVIVLGGSTELLPEKLEDFVTILAEAFGVSKDILATMPERPSADLPPHAQDGDKVDRWASNKMVNWFTDILEKHRKIEVNKSERARIVLAELGADTPQHMVDIANEAPDIIVEEKRWSVGWIAIDDLNVVSMSAHVKSFVSALLGADVAESSVTGVRQDLRWLFLGYVPDFLLSEEVTIEHLDTGVPELQLIEAVIRSAVEEANIDAEDDEIVTQAMVIRGLVPPLLTKFLAAGIDQETGLSLGQQLVADHIQAIYKENGRQL
ncbi:hypothetical protein LL06_08725 [Hoeflea sp. BAL378]|uniref:trypsin-like serine peptidase n=1 Tax=Hoeflea sp. BAL378 TaxID=1547437 RepID=UPI000512BD3B|nr:serine protease [Hoeflea sp. BAL378]KGF69767.1 hypothetical protein LL06_08725 [Hoeflea sp. BAL378]